MKAACFHGPENITVEEVERPQVGQRDILIKVNACGICGSDLHMFVEGLFTEILLRETDKGGVPGHEFAGEVVEVGPKVKGISIGDRVAAMTMGGMAEYALVAPALLNLNVYPLPDSVSYQEAATLEPLANSLHALRIGEPKEGENVFVFGAGIIGLGLIQCLKALDVGLNKIMAVDVSDKRLALAREMGADEIINASREDLLKRAHELTGDSAPIIYMGGAITPNVPLIYDCVGYIKSRPELPVISQAMIIAQQGARIVEHGVFEEAIPIEMLLLIGKHIKLLGSYGFIPSECLEAMELMRAKKVDRPALISHNFSLDETPAAFEAQRTVKESVKVMINP